MTYKVAEIFSSINGEGTRAGELAVFVRFRGCNLNCSYCDTSWANQPDTPFTSMDKEEIVRAVLETGIRNVTLTGGEPLLVPGMEEVIESLGRNGLSVEIETNGSVDLLPFDGINHRPLFTMDYKLPGSRMEDKMNLRNFELLKKGDTVKFVAGSEEDLERAAEIIRTYSLTERCHVYFSPVFGRIDPADMVEFMKKRKLNGVRLQLQLHKFIWDPMARGV